MKIWVDDVRKAPDDYIWCRSVNEVKEIILMLLQRNLKLQEAIEVIDLDHDSGEYAVYGGDYIKLLDWLEKFNLGTGIVFRLHSQNPVGRENMEKVIRKNNWILK